MVSPVAGQKTKSGAQAKAKNGPMPERYPNGGGMDQQNPPEPRTDAGGGQELRREGPEGGGIYALKPVSTCTVCSVMCAGSDGAAPYGVT